METCFIVDTYNQYSTIDKVTARYVFFLNERQWAIKEFPVEDGKLMRPLGLNEDDNFNNIFCQYKTFDDAKAYVQLIKGI